MPGPWPEGAIPLDEPAAHHLTRVLRLRSGAAVGYTDGTGTIGGGTLDLQREPSVLRGPEHPMAAPSPRVTLAVAPPHDAGRARFLVEKAAELGVAELRWVTTAATQGKPPQPARSSAWASAALEQSRGAHVTVISGPVPVGDVDGDAVVADPGAGAVDPEWWAGGDVTLLIGPEGGLRPDEVARFTRRMGLGERVLRTETAAVVAAAVVFDLARRAEKSRR